MGLDLRVLQGRHGEWIDTKFPDDSLEWRGLSLAEETGEVMRCILKAADLSRGTADEWLGKMPQEAAQVMLCLLGVAHRAGFDMEAALAAEAERLHASALVQDAYRGPGA